MKKMAISFVLGCLATVAIAFSGVAIGQQNSGNEVGRYAVAISSVPNGDVRGLYVVVIDTSSGEIFTKERHDRGDFEKIED